jgi:hypothetical protein
MLAIRNQNPVDGHSKRISAPADRDKPLPLRLKLFALYTLKAGLSAWTMVVQPSSLSAYSMGQIFGFFSNAVKCLAFDIGSVPGHQRLWFCFSLKLLMFRSLN